MYDLIVIGNVAFDVNTFPGRDNGKDYTRTNIGGAGFYSIFPASLFSKNIGLVARVGHDFPIERLTGLGINLSGLKVVESDTIKFIHTYLSGDGQKRTFDPHVPEGSLIKAGDFPEEYLSSKYIHIATNYPLAQLEFIDYLKRNDCKAVLSIDTHEAYLESDFEKVVEAFNRVDIAFIDQKEQTLIDRCSAPIKVIKMGKGGAEYLSKTERCHVPAQPREVVDKTGAGDVLASVFLINRSIGRSIRDSLGLAVQMASKSVEDYGVEFLRRGFL